VKTKYLASSIVEPPLPGGEMWLEAKRSEGSLAALWFSERGKQFRQMR
jgi:hypothetical protein